MIEILVNLLNQFFKVFKSISFILDDRFIIKKGFSFKCPSLSKDNFLSLK